MSIGIVILAAGESKRLSKPKQLVQFNQKPLLQHIIDQTALASIEDVVVVLGYKAEAIRAQVDFKHFDTLANEDWGKGISESLRHGLQFFISGNPELQGVMFLLSDQPFVSTDLIKDLIKKFDSSAPCIVASHYKDQVGVPAIFSHHFFKELQELSGDQGAKKIVKENIEIVTMVPFEKGAIDIDTEEDLKYLGLS